MNKKQTGLMVILLAIVAIGVFFILSGRRAVEIEPGENARPDQWDPASGHQFITTKIDQGASAFGVKVVPLELLEDSRCPIGTNCVWGGTVRVRTLLASGLGESEQIFELNQPITTEAEIVTLEDVTPHPTSAELGPELNEYTFMFRIDKRKFLE